MRIGYCWMILMIVAQVDVTAGQLASPARQAAPDKGSLSRMDQRQADKSMSSIRG